MSDSILQVFVFRDGAYVGNEVFADGEVTLGRSHEADLILEDQEIAPSQAVLTFDGHQATLLDLTQGDGTKVNRTTIRHSYVTPRDEIHLGPFTLKLKFVSKNGSSRGARASSLPSTAPGPSSARTPEPGFGAHRGVGGPTMGGQSAGLGTARPPHDDLSGLVGFREAPSLGEPRTEILAAHAPAGHAPQAKIPTDLVRPRDPDNSARTLAIQEAIASEVGAAPIAGFDPPAATPAASTAGFSSLGTSDVVAQSLDGSDVPAFNPSNIEAASFEVMLDSAFMTAEPETAALAPTVSERPADPAPFAPPAPSALPSFPAAAPSPSAPARHDGHKTTPATPTGRPSVPAVPPPTETDSPPRSARPDLSPAESAVSAPIARLKGTDPRPEPALRIPSAEPLPVDDDLDDEERDADERPGFSLVAQMTSAPETDRTEHLTAVEVVSYREQDVRTAHVLANANDQYVLGRRLEGRSIPDGGERGLKLIRVTGPGSAELEFSAGAKGQIRKQGRSASLDGLKKPEHASGRLGNRFRVALKAGMDAQVAVGGTMFHVRFVRPPRTIPNVRTRRPDPFFVRAFGGAIIGHLVLGMLLVVLGPKTTFNSTGGEAYAQITEQAPRDVEIKPEPPPPPPPEPEPQPEPPRAEPPPKKRKARRRPKRTRRPRRTRRDAPEGVQRGASERPVKTAGVLGAMGKLNIRAPGRRSMVQAVSNIDAVKAPGGSNFRVGALVGKTPTSDVQVGGGGGGKLLTRGSASLLKRGLGRLSGRRNGTVRGAVRKVSARRVVAQGSISREAIARVINQNLGQVQYCYERALLKKPGLKGKLVLEWQISTSGRVSRVRQKMSSIPSADVSSCIIRKLKTWRFPKPKGGVVVVSYPFIFSSVGF